MNAWRVLLLALAAGLAARAAAGQSLAEAAEKERERRARIAKRPAPSFGDADLPDRGREREATPAPSPGPAPAAAPAAAPSPEAADEGLLRKEKEAEWRLRFAAARERVAREEAGAWRKVVETVFVAGIPVQQWVSKFEETEGLRQARRDFADLEEEFRRTGLPPGWARER